MTPEEIKGTSEMIKALQAQLISEKDAEIERLQAEVERLQAEVERLKEGIEAHADSALQMEQQLVDCELEKDRRHLVNLDCLKLLEDQRAEIERLQRRD